MTHSNQITSAADALTFVKGGKARFTIVSQKTGTRFTFKVTLSKDEGAFFVNLADNESIFSMVGFMKNDGRPLELIASRKGWAQGVQDTASFKAFSWMVGWLERGDLPEALEFWHEGQCCACGRALTDPQSIASGIGPVCKSRLGG